MDGSKQLHRREKVSEHSYALCVCVWCWAKDVKILMTSCLLTILYFLTLNSSKFLSTFLGYSDMVQGLFVQAVATSLWVGGISQSCDVIHGCITWLES